MNRSHFAYPVAAMIILLSGCVINRSEDVGPAGEIPVDVALAHPERARLDLRMKVGDLTLGGGSSELVDGTLRYRGSSKPEVRSDSSTFRSSVNIEQRMGSETHSRGDDYAWHLKVNDQVPWDVSVEFGVGQAKLNLGSVDLRSLEVHMGVGEVNLNLEGKPQHDYSVVLRGGVGHAVVYLPAQAGIVAKASGGIGGINVQGLELRDGQYVNQAYGHAPATIHIDAQGGIGQIELIAR